LTKEIIATHTRPDLDSVTGVWLYKKANPGKVAEEIIFLKGGDEVNSFSNSNLVFIDRGRGLYDHHQNHNNDKMTSAEKVAQSFGLDNCDSVKKILNLVKLNDLRGITQPLDAGDMIKRMSHNHKLSDEERMAKGLRLIEDVFQFKKTKATRDNEFTRKVIKRFLEQKKEDRLLKIERYCDQLIKGNFQRSFDFAEVLTAEKYIYGEQKAIEFGLALLVSICEDDINFNKAFREYEKAKKINVAYNDLLVMADTENPMFNKVARMKGASVIIQKSSIGTQIFFSFQKVKNSWIDNIMAVIRLEEQIQNEKQKIITSYFKLKMAGRFDQVKEWYYYISGDAKGGRFILNKSLTAPDPEIPTTKLSSEKIASLVKEVLNRRDAFYFKKYASIRLRKKN
jgi:hypothetical protein